MEEIEWIRLQGIEVRRNSVIVVRVTGGQEYQGRFIASTGMQILLVEQTWPLDLSAFGIDEYKRKKDTLAHAIFFDHIVCISALFEENIRIWSL